MENKTKKIKKICEISKVQNIIMKTSKTKRNKKKKSQILRVNNDFKRTFCGNVIEHPLAIGTHLPEPNVAGLVHQLQREARLSLSLTHDSQPENS